MSKTITLAFLIFLFFLPLKSQTGIAIAGQEINVTANAELRQQTFEKVWNTVYEKHFDPTFGGVNWKKVGEIYRPKAMAAQTDKEFYAVLQDMLGELHQSHFAIIPPNTEIAPTAYGEGEIGIDLQLIGKDAVITKVDADSSAALSGLKTGFIIRKIGERNTNEILAPLEEKMIARRETEAEKRLRRRRALLAALSGKINSTIDVEVLNAENKIRIFNIGRKAFKGEMSLPFGNFPPQRVVFESKILPADIGYIRFNIWVIPQMQKLREAILAMHNTRGIILDLRGNPGGIGIMTNGLAGLLVEKKTSLGTAKSRTAINDFSVYPQENPFTGKIAILIDSGTGSASEVFTAGMQGIKRAKIIGERSAGAVLPAVIEKLPDGSSFLYAISDYKSPAGILIEGQGVKPDTEILLTRKSLLEKKDLQLEAAIKEIQQ